MSNFKGTRGKWVFHKYAKGTVQSKEGRTIANYMVYSTNTDNGEHIEESMYNALLCSKAPEMLDMLESCLLAFQQLGLKEPEGIKQLIKEATEL
jgi:hypothetical protein